MVRRIRLALLILVAVVLQTTLLTHFDLFGAAPGLCVLCVLAVAFEDGPESGALLRVRDGTGARPVPDHAARPERARSR